MNFINAKNFLKQPKGIQEVFMNWWKPEVGNLYFDNTHTTVSKLRVVTEQTENDFDYELMYLKVQNIIPLFTEGQLRQFIEDKTDKYIEARKPKGECYKIWLHSKHSNDCIFYNKLGQDLIQAYWKIACKIARKEMHNKCFLINCNNCKFMKKRINQNGKTKCKCLKYDKEVFYRGKNPHFKHHYIYPCEECNGNDFTKTNITTIDINKQGLPIVRGGGKTMREIYNEKYR